MSKAPGIVMAVTKQFAPDFAEMKDLVGKNVGVSAPGSASHTFLKLILDKSDVNPDEVGVVGVGNAAGAVAAIRTGSEIQATVGYDPVMTMLESSGDIKVVVDLRDTEQTRNMLGTDFTFLSLIANKAYIDKNPEAVQAVVNGVVKALKWIPTVTPEEVLAAVPEEFWKENKDLYLESIKRNLSGLSTDGQVTRSEAEGVYQALLTEDKQVDPSKIDFADTFDNSFAEKANAN
jgi:NitT/TauT family transport system substrate-binding protein